MIAAKDHVLNAGEKRIHRRHHIKADGRDLFLYGYEPHLSPPTLEEVNEIAKGGEMRWHPLRKEWNIYAAHRQNRTYKPASADDPLAPSMPKSPPTEIPFSDFEIAIFENKFTSLHPEAPQPIQIDGVDSGRAFGRCEVVVFTPQETGSLWTIGQDRRRLLVAAWIDRYSALFDMGCKYVLPFENRGNEVGVTLPHPHGQIYGFSHLPDVQAKAVNVFESGYQFAKELTRLKGDYGIGEFGGVMSFCPPYARFPYEIWLAPRKRRAGPWDFSDEELDGFAYQLGDICRRYDAFFERETAYMLSLHAAPAGQERGFHFTAQFYPILRDKNRTKFLASVEQSTGCFTVDVMPETAADTLRGC